MRECIDPRAHEPLRVLQLENVGDDAQAPLVRLIDDAAVDFRGELLVFAATGVDPNLDNVDLPSGKILHRLAPLRLGGDPVRHRGTSRLGHRNAAAGTQKPRRAGNGLPAHRQQFDIVRSHA
jgi:hypothetical protein